MIHIEHLLNTDLKPLKGAINHPHNWVEQKEKREREIREKLKESG